MFHFTECIEKFRSGLIAVISEWSGFIRDTRDPDSALLACSVRALAAPGARTTAASVYPLLATNTQLFFSC